MASLTTNIIFLLGAGASTNADIAGIGKMSETFMNRIEDLTSEHLSTFDFEFDKNGYTKKTVVEACRLLHKKIGKKSNKDFNIETLLEALVNLESQEHILFDILNYTKGTSKYDRDYIHLKNILMKFIRKECENIGDVSYLHPLYAFLREGNKLDIFTLNYDGTIEKMCKENNILYTDGFTEEWDSKLFEEEKYKICIYKLHGSLYWFKTEMGKHIKLPIKYIEVEKLMYFMDEKITETLIWPMITKDYSTGPFPWLMETFRNKLRTCHVCFVLGYSFRDDSIKRLVLDELQNNGKLWLFIVDHNAHKIKKGLTKNKKYLKQRIVAINTDIDKILLSKTLIEKHRLLSAARDREEQQKNMLLIAKNIRAISWNNVFDLYRNIPHLDRIKYLVTNVLDTYPSETEEIPYLRLVFIRPSSEIWDRIAS